MDFDWWTTAAEAHHERRCQTKAIGGKGSSLVIRDRAVHEANLHILPQSVSPAT